VTPRDILRELWRRAVLELDACEWARKTAPLAVRATTGTRRVLFAEAVWMLATAKVESLLAAGLAREGYEPHLLLPVRNRAVERAYRATCPLARVHTIEERLDDTIRKAGEDDAARVLEGRPLDDLLALEIDGFRIGRSALSSVVRRLRVGRLDESHRGEARVALARAFAVKRVAQGLIPEVRPDLALFVERGYTPAGEFFDACVAAGVDTVQWLGAPQSDRLLFKRYRRETRSDHPLALDDSTWAAVRRAPFGPEDEDSLVATLAANYNSGAWFNRQQLQVGKRAAAREEARAVLGVAPGRKAAGVFCHILYDATFFYGESLYPDYETWLVETVRHATANPHLDWLIKVHPVNVWRSKMDGKAMEQLEAAALRREFGELPAHVRLVPADTQLNTWAFFGAIDFGITVRGTVGMEMPCLGIPTVTAGTGRYSGRGFTIDPATRADYADVLARLHEVPPLDAAAVSLARRYAHATFELRPVRFESFGLEFDARSFGVVERAMDVRLPERSATAFRDEPDVVRLLDWLTRDRRTDLLGREIAPPPIPGAA
jgi:hypothetical protein